MRLPRTIWLLCAGVILALAACEARPELPVAVDSMDGERPDAEVWDPVMRITETGMPRVTIRAGYLSKFETQDSTYTEFHPAPDTVDGRVQAVFYDESGTPTATLTALELLYLDNQRRFTAKGDVVVVTADGTRLETEFLRWSETDRQITTPGFVRITKPDELWQGYELVADEDLATFEIARPSGRTVFEEP